MRQGKLLVIEDDRHIQELISLYAEKNGYQIKLAETGLEGLETFYDYLPDLLILDIMLPEMDGWEVCREIRRDSKIPIIMLTGKGEGYDKIKGLNLGADDYVVKPFDPKELMARVKAVLRRTNPFLNSSEIIKLPELIIDLSQYKVFYHDKEISLPPKEMELLYFLASYPNQVFTREQLLDKIWGFDYEGDYRTIDVHIKRIREKIDGAGTCWQLKTIRGIGYKFEVNDDCSE